jgi:hypothetical protein
VYREDCEAGCDPERKVDAPGRVEEKEKEKDAVRCVPQDVPKVVSERVCEAEEPRIESPTQISEQKGLFPKGPGKDDLVETREKGALIVELGMSEEDRVIVVVHEIEEQRPCVKRKTESGKPETGIDGLAAGGDGSHG